MNEVRTMVVVFVFLLLVVVVFLLLLRRIPERLSVWKPVAFKATVSSNKFITFKLMAACRTHSCWSALRSMQNITDANLPL